MFGVDGGGGLAWLQTTTRALDVDNMQEIDYYRAAHGCKVNSLAIPRSSEVSSLTDAVGDVDTDRRCLTFYLSRTSRDLKNNLISTVEPGAFRGLPALRRL